ncbi:MAG: hypothetical protein PUA95_09975 [Lactimicrobium massiliense]|nr:HipA domain-containing protein [Lactimicrobium massiliense]MDD6231039.1 hypothetical protein [Lactimicrobium massiliense]
MPLFTFKRNNPVYVLMHKDKPVLQGSFDFSRHGFGEDVEIIDPVLLPVGVTHEDGTLSLHKLNHWYRWRGIPGYRVGLLQLEERLEIHDPLELLEREYALSVSDTFWRKAADDPITWKEVNFFHRSFDQQGFGLAMFSNVGARAGHNARHTPNNTTCGYHRKAWFKRNGRLFLLKGGTPFYQQEPVNEWLACRIGHQLGIQAVPYNNEIYENNLVSVCPAMTNEDVDLVTAGDVLNSVHSDAKKFQYDDYLKALESHGIKDGKQRLSDMLVMDYLMMNTDRHNQNLGILVDANTGRWLQCAPVFDTGTGLGCLVDDDDIFEQYHSQSCKLFNARNFSHELLLDYIDLKRYDFNALDGLPRAYGNQLVKYQSTTNISNKRINESYRLFCKRILMIRKAAASVQ